MSPQDTAKKSADDFIKATMKAWRSNVHHGYPERIPAEIRDFFLFDIPTLAHIESVVTYTQRMHTERYLNTLQEAGIKAERSSAPPSLLTSQFRQQIVELKKLFAPKSAPTKPQANPARQQETVGDAAIRGATKGFGVGLRFGINHFLKR